MTGKDIRMLGAAEQILHSQHYNITKTKEKKYQVRLIFCTIIIITSNLQNCVEVHVNNIQFFFKI